MCRAEMMNQPDDILVVMVTAASMDEATRISEGVVKARLAACATTIPTVQSMYWWEGKIASERESMIVLKTTRSRYPELENMIRAMHSYKVPEIIAVQTCAGSMAYVQWVRDETTGST